MVKTSGVIHQTIDHQPVIGRINLRHAAVMTFKAQTVWSDDAVKLVQRCKVDGGFRVSRQPCNITANHMALEFEGMP